MTRNVVFSSGWFLVLAKLIHAELSQLLLADTFNRDRKGDLIYELEIAEIIPTVLDVFTPLLSVSISWENASAEVGNTIEPSALQKRPVVQFLDELPDFAPLQHNVPQLTLTLSDPDAPSRDDPEWSEMCHWIATCVPLTDTHDVYTGLASTTQKLKEVMPWKPPGPPPKTGKHRYVFVALAPRNGSTEHLNLRRPNDRQHWGYDSEREGLRAWAADMGLMVVGANFIYSQNDEQ